MTSNVLLSPILVLETKGELAEYLSGYANVCENLLQSVLDIVIPRIEIVVQKKFDVVLGLEIRESVLDRRLDSLKKKCLDDYCQKVLTFDDFIIAKLLEEVKRKGSIQDESSRKAIEKRVFQNRQILADFVMKELDSLRPFIVSDIKEGLKKRDVQVTIPENLIF